MKAPYLPVRAHTHIHTHTHTYTHAHTHTHTHTYTHAHTCTRTHDKTIVESRESSPPQAPLQQGRPGAYGR